MKTVIKQAETFRRTLKFTSLRNGANIDLTGCTAYSQMRTEPGGELIDTAVCTVDPDQAIISALWTAEQTSAWNVGDCGFDIWLVCDGEQKPIYTEECTVVKSYTENMGD